MGGPLSSRKLNLNTTEAIPQASHTGHVTDKATDKIRNAVETEINGPGKLIGIKMHRAWYPSNKKSCL